jgi:peroxiredoxin Q/BCP
MSIEAGDRAIEFTLPASGGRTVRSAALAGHPYVLYFYPKADTPGCTREACAFQEALGELGALRVAVIGVSPDAMPAIEKFAAKYGIGFPLASDPGHELASAYDVWVEKLRYGRRYMGIERSTFLIDATGTVARVWRKVTVEGHVAEVAAAVAALTGAASGS